MPLPQSKSARPLRGLLIAAALASPAWAGGTSNVIVVTTTADGMDAVAQ
jgi:hypothetical protein